MLTKDEQVELIARALCEADEANWDVDHCGNTPNGCEPEEMRDQYRYSAGGVLSALNEAGLIIMPEVATQDMAYSAIGNNGIGPLTAHDVYSAMVETVKKTTK